MLPGWVIIRKQSLIVGFALARLELSHKADIEEWKPGCAPLKYFLGREKQGGICAAVGCARSLPSFCPRK